MDWAVVSGFANADRCHGIGCSSVRIFFSPILVSHNIWRLVFKMKAWILEHKEQYKRRSTVPYSEPCHKVWQTVGYLDLSLLLTVTILLLKQLCWSEVYRLTSNLVYSLEVAPFLHTLYHVMHNFWNYAVGNSRDPPVPDTWIWELPKGFCCTWISFLGGFISDIWFVGSNGLWTHEPKSIWI